MTTLGATGRPASLWRHGVETMRLGVPLIGGNLAQFAIQLTDAIMLGWYDVEALAAVSLGSVYFFALNVLGAGFAFAVMPMVAAEEAAGNTGQVRRITRMGLWLSVFYAMAAMPFLIWGGEILKFTGQTEAVAASAGAWLAIAGWGLLPALWAIVLRNFLAALGRTRVVFWALVFAALANALADYMLIFGNWGAPELGIRGAAVASFVSFSASLVFLAVYAARALPQHELFVRFWRPDWPVFGRVFRLGWPIGLTNLSEVGLFAASAFMMGWVGTVALAAHGIALHIASATFLVHVGLSSAATIRAGAAFGRRDPVALRGGAIAATCLSAAMVVATVVLFLTAPRSLIGLFIDPADPARHEVIAIGVVLLALAAWFQAADAAQVMALGFLRGVQDTRVPMWIAAFSYWAVGLPVAYLLAFPLGVGAPGIWLGLVAGLSLAGALLMTRFWLRAPSIA